MATYAWDEISSELLRIDTPAQQDGEWEHVRSWGVVSVWRNSRGHTAIEIAEQDSAEAAQRILEAVPEYRDWAGA